MKSLKWTSLIAVVLTILGSTQVAYANNLPTIRIGSKNFTESYILAEILAQAIERQGLAKVERRFGMGGTGILFEALLNNEIDVYPEYTGTLSIAILHRESPLDLSQMRDALDPQSLLVSEPLGFNNSYGLAIKRTLAEKLNLNRISQLKDHRSLQMAFSYEFMERKDGYPALVRHYNMRPKDPMSMDHSLVYTSIAENKVDVVEVYTTDSKIEKLDLVVLEDDLAFFPKYEGVYLLRKELYKKAPSTESTLQALSGSISDDEMIRLNGLSEISKVSFSDAAKSYFDKKTPTKNTKGYWVAIKTHMNRHLLLVFVPALISILIGVPMGICAAKIKVFGQFFLVFSGLVQTIPSLALLCFLIPFFGIGIVPSMIALVLYGLLPIVRNTYSGIFAIDPRHHEVARALGLNGYQKLLRIEFPLASIHILGGIKTATIINVGMATLAAFIGAGGYGALIVTGLALNNTTIILQGALPAAGLAIAVHFLFEIFDRWVTPTGLKY